MFIMTHLGGNFPSFAVLYFMILSQSYSFLYRALFHIDCFNQSSAWSDGLECSRCDLVFEFCVSESDYWSSCYPGQSYYDFANRGLLGSCAPEVEDFPEVAFERNMTDSTRYLQIRIQVVKKSGLVKRKSLVDRFVYNVTNFKSFPGSPADSPKIANAVHLHPISFHNIGPSAPILKLTAALECPIYRSGLGCRKLCSPTPTTVCFPNGTSACRGNCSSLTSSTEAPLTVSMTSETLASGNEMTMFYITTIIGICSVVIVAVIVTAVIYFLKSKRRQKCVLNSRASGIADRPVALSRLHEMDNNYYQQMCRTDTVTAASPYDEDPSVYESMYEEVGPVYSESGDDYECCGNPYEQIPNCEKRQFETRYVRQ